ncbi:MAG: glycosyltransferase family 39 protein [Acidobacteriia bacterium]|nr:glycosyltransferase family 39 protein [Terriglobia bacterium]
MAGRRDYVLVIAILAVGWIFWLHRMGVNDHDDMLSSELMFARQSVASIVFHNPWPDQSPLYFLVLHGARTIGESPFAVRFLNAALLTMTLVATYSFGLAFSGSRAVAGAAMFLGAISPTSLWLVRYGRMYSLQVLLSVLALLFVLRYLDRRRPRDLVALSLLSVLNVYVHFVGFLITALLFIPLVVDASLEVRRRLQTDRSRQAWRPLMLSALAALAVLVLVFPQVVRFVSLVGSGIPLQAEVSLPRLSPTFLDRVSWFWFVNADWGLLRRGDRVVTAVYVGSIGVLAIAGLAAVRRRTGVIAALWILLPLAGIGLAAARMDVRDRYFVWTLPLLWIAVATGGFGALPSGRLTGIGADVARGFRAALVLAVAAGSLWLLWNKLPERYPEWTKLMDGLARIYRPSMMVYMPPGSPMGIPRLLALQRGLAPELQRVRVLGPETRAEFLKEVERAQDFVFLAHERYGNDELSLRARYLEDHKYRKATLPVFGAHADIFTRGELDGFSREQRLAPDPSPDAIVAWARQELRQAPKPASAAPVLANAVVARVQSDGVAREGRLFISQRGESGSWRLGPLEWDAVEEVRTSSGAVEQDMIAAHPADQSVLVVAFPALEMKKSLRLAYGIADSGLMFRSGADVNLTLYVNGAPTMDASCPNTPGWKELAADTTSLDGKVADVVMLITTAKDTSRHFAFRLDPSSQAAPRSVSDASHVSGPVVLTGGRTLKDAVDRLQVYRLEGERRIDAQSERHTYAAGDMHEATGPGGEGAVSRRWALGPLLWDAVGVTRQFSGGEARDGVWAHPKNGTTLVIETSTARVGDLLRGYFGLTDFSVAQATGLGVTAPVRFKVSIDGRSAFEQEAARIRGWIGWAIPVGSADREHSLRIEISCATDSWAHFVFDLWSS